MLMQFYCLYFIVLKVNKLYKKKQANKICVAKFLLKYFNSVLAFTKMCMYITSIIIEYCA